MSELVITGLNQIKVTHLNIFHSADVTFSDEVFFMIAFSKYLLQKSTKTKTEFSIWQWQ